MAPGRAPAADDPMLSPYGPNADDIPRCHALLLQAMSSPTVAKGLRALRARGRTPAKVERAARALDTAASMLRKHTAASQQLELVLGFIGGSTTSKVSSDTSASSVCSGIKSEIYSHASSDGCQDVFSDISTNINKPRSRHRRPGKRWTSSAATADEGVGAIVHFSISSEVDTSSEAGDEPLPSIDPLPIERWQHSQNIRRVVGGTDTHRTSQGGD